ncbi:MAG: MerR family transcriptional regulator [Candidatus Nitrospinota bacterium M3_3B_026]
MRKKGEQGTIKGTNVPEKMFYKIRDVAKIADVKPHVLRYWESEFPQLSPHKNKNGQRVYTRKDIDIALEIKHLLYEEKYSIAGARKRLKKKKSAPRTTGAMESVRQAREELAGLLDIMKKEKV